MATESGFSRGWKQFVDHKWIKKLTSYHPTARLDSAAGACKLPRLSVCSGSFRSLWAIGIAGGIHRYPKGFANPCLDCGFAEFVVPKNELHALVEGLTRLQTKSA